MNTNIAPLETVLGRYNQWAAKGQPLLSDVDAEELKGAIAGQGGLLPSQEERLMALVNRLLSPMNSFFNRHFTAGISPLLCADVFGNKEGRYLLFDRGGKIAMLGGIADKGESLKRCAERECLEESGYGCTLTGAKPVVVRDYTLGGPIPRISVVYSGALSGEPVSNYEAKNFFWKRADEIGSLSDQEGFSAHVIMMKEALRCDEKETIGYMSAQQPLTESEKAVIRKKVNWMKRAEENPRVAEAIDKIEAVFSAVIAEFSQFTKKIIEEYPDFEHSRDILWPKEERTDDEEPLKRKIAYEKEHAWNDFDRLWDFLKPWQGRLLSTNPNNTSDSLFSINKLFATKIKIREAGTVKLITSIEDREGKIHSIPIVQRYDESFSSALYRGVYHQLGLEIADGSELVGMDDPNDGFEEDQFGNDNRIFRFKSQAKL